jgi:hypothetical protein
VFRDLTVAVAVLLALAVVAPLRGTGPARAARSLPAEIGPADDTLRLLFTPATFPAGTFTVHRTDERITTLAARLKGLDPAPADGAWHAERAGVFDAFGAEGPYDKPRLARLFGGLSPVVARGTLVTPAGRLAITLIAPYPDASLSSLRQGTMVIVTELPRR